MDKRKVITILAFFAGIILLGCQKENSTNTGEGTVPSTGFSKGKNRFVTKIDGDDREYYVHVPQSYTGTANVPVVFMVHGTSGNGLDMYDRSGWKEVGEDENIITVFPSSGRYCIIDQGEQKNTTKWNTPPDAEWVFCAGQTPKDDIKFLRTILSELESRFKIDSKRIYLCGFSNGGQMAAKCAVELSDKLAAVVESAGSFYKDTTYIPKRKLPILFQIGNEDYGPGNTGPAIPMSQLGYLISTPGLSFKNGSFYTKAHTHITSFGLNPSFTISGDTNSVVYATYQPLSGTVNVFKYAMIKGLRHAYPNGDNHWMEAARVDWAFFKQYAIP